jgi:DNA processing protein
LVQISTYIDSKTIIPESKEEEQILEHLTHEPIHVNELARLTDLTMPRLNSTLTVMEMKGMVRNVGNMQYVLAR